MVEQGDSFKASLILNRLFNARLNPAQATRAIAAEFARHGLTHEQAYERIRAQHRYFLEGNLTMSQRQGVDWDHVTINLEAQYEIPEEERVSKNRLVPVGTKSHDPDLQDLAF